MGDNLEKTKCLAKDMMMTQLVMCTNAMSMDVSTNPCNEPELLGMENILMKP